MASLEEIQAKFDTIQKKLESGCYKYLSDALTNFFGSMWVRCKKYIPFEVWYDEFQSDVDFLNRVLDDEKTPRLTKEEFREVYEHTKRNILKNVVEGRERSRSE